MSDHIKEEAFTLSSGMTVPAVGFGTCKHSFTGDFRRVIDSAINAGYRYFDTASFYETERDLGAALRESGIARQDLTVATKIWHEETGRQGTRDAIERSLDRLGLDYIDLYLIHWPKRNAVDEAWKENILETWQVMEEYRQKGLIKALGLSNFLPHHLDVILENCTVRPVVDQLELHIGYSQEYALRYVQEQGILAQAWSPMGRGKTDFTCNDMIGSIAQKYGVSRQKLSLRFLYQKGIMTLPLSMDPEHIRDNRNIHDFEITKEDMSILTCMPQVGWLGEHPDFSPPVTKHVNLNQ